MERSKVLVSGTCEPLRMAPPRTAGYRNRPLRFGELAHGIPRLGCDRGLNQHVPLRVPAVPVVEVSMSLWTRRCNHICTSSSLPPLSGWGVSLSISLHEHTVWLTYVHELGFCVYGAFGCHFLSLVYVSQATQALPLLSQFTLCISQHNLRLVVGIGVSTANWRVWHCLAVCLNSPRLWMHADLLERA